MLRVGLVGTGDAGRHHARALGIVAGEGRLRWTAICARDAARLAAFRSELDVPADVATFASLEALIDARACDAVILATPDGIHAQQVELAARAGLHVLVEKPLALTRSEGERAVARMHARRRREDGVDPMGKARSGDGRLAREGRRREVLSVSVAHRAVSRVIVSGDAGEIEAIGTLGARGDGELWHRAPRQPPVAIAFEPENPYAAQLRDFVARTRAPEPFTDDPALLANLDVLDRIDTLTRQAEKGAS